MIYPQNFECKLGFSQIRIQLKTYCSGTLGEELVDKMRMSTNIKFVRTALNQSSEFCSIISDGVDFPTQNYFDLRTALSALKVEGSFIDTDSLLKLKLSLETFCQIEAFFNRNKDNDRFCYLERLFKPVELAPTVVRSASAIIDDKGYIYDGASPKLREIRSSLTSAKGRVSKTVNSVLSQAKSSGIAEEDTIVTIREGRTVIPIPAALKRRINGIVHDVSATGRTVFIEPAEVVELNNQIRELETSERREIVKILSAFSSEIRPHIPELLSVYQLLGKIDFIRAKAKWALAENASLPKIEEKPIINWVNAYHPNLRRHLAKENKETIPLTIRLLEDEGRVLLISGPNAGGKSVCLKTVGLLQYMLQCGMLIPVGEGSVSGLFSNIFMDMGDEQSIENDLSTYSSHLTNMKYFVNHCDPQSLILIDEFGTGTEPAIGGAIAEAILERLLQQGTFGIITTHYTNLKHFASSRVDVMNGAMLYDTGKLKPLFKLEIGSPGSSFAFEIARSIGLPEDVLAKASDSVGQEHINFDKHLREVARDRNYWQKKRNSIRLKEKNLDLLAEEYSDDLKEAEKAHKKIIAEARKEAQSILAETNKKVENAIHEIRRAQADKEKTKTIRKELEELKEDVDKKISKSGSKKLISKLDNFKKTEKKRGAKLKKQKVESEDRIALTVGSKVRINDSEMIGEIIEIDNSVAVVAFGSMASTVSLDKLLPISNTTHKKIEKQRNNSNSIKNQVMTERLEFKQQLDVRGQRADEAINSVLQFIDKGIVLGEKRLTILHGKGNGILREQIRNYLRTEPAVSKYYDAPLDQGGAGITIVELGV
ncbi:MAG: endonuclease MutS2 [Bacteroidales bacterium]